MHIEVVPIEAVLPDPANLREHPDENIENIMASLHEFGQQKPVHVDAHGFIRAGNGTHQAATRLGWTHIEIVRSQLEGARAQAYSIADNRTTDKSYFKQDELAQVLLAMEQQEICDMKALGYTHDEIVQMLPEEKIELTDPGPQLDRAQELQVQWGTAPGQLWVIPGRWGDHRILCGDSTSFQDTTKLCPGKVQGIFTSPPYAEQRHDQYGGIPAEDYVEWWAAIQANCRAVLAETGSLFVNIKPHVEEGERHLYVLDLVLAMRRQWDWLYIDELCWTRPGFPGHWPNRLKNQWESVFHWSLQKEIKFRPVQVAHASEDWDVARKGPTSVGSGFTKTKPVKHAKHENRFKAEHNRYENKKTKSVNKPTKNQSGLMGGKKVNREGVAYPGNVLDEIGSSGDSNHPAAFPPQLPQFFLKGFSDPGDVWWDPFMGSGTTVVAAEQCARVGWGMERDPRYVAVALERLTGMGLQPYQLVDSDYSDDDERGCLDATELMIEVDGIITGAKLGQ